MAHHACMAHRACGSGFTCLRQQGWHNPALASECVKETKQQLAQRTTCHKRTTSSRIRTCSTHRVARSFSFEGHERRTGLEAVGQSVDDGVQGRHLPRLAAAHSVPEVRQQPHRPQLKQVLHRLHQRPVPLCYLHHPAPMRRLQGREAMHGGDTNPRQDAWAADEYTSELLHEWLVFTGGSSTVRDRWWCDRDVLFGVRGVAQSRQR